MPQTQASPVHPVKLKRQVKCVIWLCGWYISQMVRLITFLVLQMLRRQRRERRTADLIKQDKEIDNQMQEAAIGRARELDTTVRGKYSIWRKEYENPNSDSTVKLMRDQIIMAKAYATIAKAKNDTVLYDSLIKHSRESQLSIGEATTDAELHPRSCYINSLVNLFRSKKFPPIQNSSFLLFLTSSVRLIKQKPWVTFSPQQRTSYMIVLQ